MKKRVQLGFAIATILATAAVWAQMPPPPPPTPTPSPSPTPPPAPPPLPTIVPSIDAGR